MVNSNKIRVSLTQAENYWGSISPRKPPWWCPFCYSC